MPELCKKEYERLYIEYFRRIGGFVSKFVNRYEGLFSKQEVGDLTAEIFKRLLESWGRFRGKSKESTFVFGIAQNYLNMELRERITAKKHQPEFTEPSTGLSHDWGTSDEERKEGKPLRYAVSEPQPTQENGVMGKERESILNQCLEELEKKDPQTAIVIRYSLLDHTDKEIGEILGLSLKQVFNMRRKGYWMVRAFLKARGVKSGDEI